MIVATGSSWCFFQEKQNKKVNKKVGIWPSWSFNSNIENWIYPSGSAKNGGC